MTTDGTDLEPKDYFEDLKGKISETQLQQLEENRTFLYGEIQKADNLGQKNLLHKSAFMWEVLEKEMVLHAAGLTRYVLKDDVTKLIDNVKPKNSVKIAELENYPRVIPDRNALEIQSAKDLNLFDTIVIVYTDFTDEEVLTPVQKETVKRNKDPIAFGMFLNDTLRIRHDRMYFITDWEDEFCDLTFSKMLDKMSELGIKNPEKTIEPNFEYVNSVIAKAKQEINDAKEINRPSPNKAVKPKNGFFSFIGKVLYR